MAAKNIKPMLFPDDDVQRCTFSPSIPSTNVKRSDIFINIPANTSEIDDFLIRRGTERGYAAIKLKGVNYWQAIDVVVNKSVSGEYTSLAIKTVEYYLGCEAIALGVDQRLRREDIDGATIIKKNKSGTKWVFAHSSVEEHHDRMLLAETAMATLFDELTYSRLSRVLTVIVQDKPKNQQLGELTVMEHINNFKHDCMRMARWHEGELSIGDHVKEEEEHYVYNMLQKAFATAEKKWKLEKSAEFNQISDHLAAIKKRLESRHNFKYRWEKPTVFPNAQPDNTESTEE